MDQKKIQEVSKVKLSGTEIDDKIDFNHHINKICKSALNQLKILIRAKCLLRFEEKKVIVNTFEMSNSNYCSIVRNLSSVQLLSKIEKLQKRALPFLLTNHGSTCGDLLEKSGCPNMGLRRQRTLGIERITYHLFSLYFTLTFKNWKCKAN